MNTEELRLNKQLLKEISKRKKEKQNATSGMGVGYDLSVINESQNLDF